MNELELKMRVKAIMHNTIDSFMRQNGVAASIMIDVLTAEIANLYPSMQQEYLAQLDEAKAKLEEEADSALNQEETE